MSSSPVHYFVTGTDTEVGKTLVACAVMVGLQRRWPQRRVSGFKPVVAGTYLDAMGQRVNEDLLSLISASNLGQSLDDICPYILDTPAAPHLVAKDIALEMRIPKIMETLQGVLGHADQVVMEGAGGFLVPLNEKESLADLAQNLKWPVIVVVGMRLGCLSHALLTLEAIRSRGLRVAGWVANTMDPQMSHLRENLADLQMRIPEPCLGQIPHLPDSLKKADHGAYTQEAVNWAASHLNLDLL